MNLKIKKILNFHFHQYPLYRELADLIGAEAALLVCKVFGGTSIKVPAWNEAQRIIKELDIYEEYLKCGEARKVASLFHVPHNRVHAIVAKFRRLSKGEE